MTATEIVRPTLAEYRAHSVTVVGVTLLLVLATVLSLAIDVPVARVFLHQQLPSSIDRPLREGLEICETFGHGFGATLIVIAVAVLDAQRRELIGWLFGGSLGVGLLANTMKVIIHRTRPRDFTDLDHVTVWDTFASVATNGMGTQSFPSAHTATAVGLAVMLSTLYPRGRWYFFILAALVGAQRIVSSAHFPSDVFCGAVIGWIAARIIANLMMKYGSLLKTTL